MTITTVAPADIGNLQVRLLHDPSDVDAWQALEALPRLLPEAVAFAAPPTPEPLAATLDFEQLRPLNLKYAGPGSAFLVAALGSQRNDWLQWVREGAYEQAARIYQAESTAEWGNALEPLQLYQFGHWCHGRGFHAQAISLLNQLIGRQETAELGLWAQLYSLRSEIALGRINDVLGSLPALAYPELAADSDPSTPLEVTRYQVAFHATLSLAWIHLGRGDRQGAEVALEQLRSSPLAAENSTELGLLSRVLSTLAWLNEHPRDQLSHIADRADRCGFAMAVDAIQLSSCGTLQRVQGWMIDPGNQIERLCLIRGNRVQRLDVGRARYQSRHDLGDVMARCGCPAGYEAGFSLVTIQGKQERQSVASGEGVELFVVLRDGEQFLVRRKPVSSELTTAEMKQSVDTLFNDRCELLAPEAAVKLRAAWSDQLRRKMECPPTLKRYGPVPEQPELSIVVPLYGRIDFMEYQLNWFNAWLRRGGDEALRYQLIYVLDDPRLKQAFEALARRCHTLYRMPFETVINATNLGYAGANNVGSRQARGDTLLLLNSDVLPERQESFAILLRSFQQHRGTVGALGARLLFDNGGIQHAGMEFVRQDDLPGCLSDVWLNEHPMKGLNLGFAEGERACLQEVEAATAACLMLSTELFRELGGLSTDFVIGDFEDSDLCLRIRAMGLPVLVDLEASFYHLERQSVGQGESNDLLKTKVVALNALTQQERWGGAIELLKRSRLEAMG